MGMKYEIRYYLPKTIDRHYADTNDLEIALQLMKDCKKETGSKYIILIWRP